MARKYFECVRVHLHSDSLSRPAENEMWNGLSPRPAMVGFGVDRSA